jgi:hypothetical protein
MSLPNAIASGGEMEWMENAQFNTMSCKQSVNLGRRRKKEKKKTGSRERGFPF